MACLTLRFGQITGWPMRPDSNSPTGIAAGGRPVVRREGVRMPGRDMSKTKKHYLVVNASHFANSNTERFCQIFEQNLEASCSRIELRRKHIPFADGTYRIPRNDVLRKLREQVLNCDGIFIATPTHWFSAPGRLKAFIDHLTPIEAKLWKKERLLALAIYAPEGGELGVFQAVVPALNHMGFSLVGNGYAYRRSRRKSEAWVVREIKGMAKRFSC
jgi:NAD(P)H-dependent FMN reductase